MTILTSNKQLFPVQYGMGCFKYYNNIHGGNIFRKFVFPAGRFVMNKIIKPFIKNNKDDIKKVINEGGKTIIKNLIMKENPPTFSDIKNEAKNEILNPILKTISKKPLLEHLQGEGLSRRSKNIIKNLTIKKGSGLKLLE